MRIVMRTSGRVAAHVVHAAKAKINDPDTSAYVELPTTTTQTSDRRTFTTTTNEQYPRQFDPLGLRPPTRQLQVAWSREIVLEIRRLSLTIWTLANRVLLGIGVWFACDGTVKIATLAQLDELDTVSETTMTTAVVHLAFGLWIITLYFFGKPWISRSAVSNGRMSWERPSVLVSLLN